MAHCGGNEHSMQLVPVKMRRPREANGDASLCWYQLFALGGGTSPQHKSSGRAAREHRAETMFGGSSLGCTTSLALLGRRQEEQRGGHERSMCFLWIVEGGWWYYVVCGPVSAWVRGGAGRRFSMVVSSLARDVVCCAVVCCTCASLTSLTCFFGCVLGVGVYGVRVWGVLMLVIGNSNRVD